MELPKKLKYLRKRNGWSQLELSEKLGVSRQAISGWEAGSSQPSTGNLQCLSKLYDVPMEVLLNDEKKLEFVEEVRSKPVVIQKRRKQKKRHIVVAIIVLGLLIAACTYIAIIIITDESEDKLPLDKIEGSEIETDREKDFNLEWE